MRLRNLTVLIRPSDLKSEILSIFCDWVDSYRKEVNANTYAEVHELLNQMEDATYKKVRVTLSEWGEECSVGFEDQDGKDKDAINLVYWVKTVNFRWFPGIVEINSPITRTGGLVKTFNDMYNYTKSDTTRYIRKNLQPGPYTIFDMRDWKIIYRISQTQKYTVGDPANFTMRLTPISGKDFVPKVREFIKSTGDKHVMKEFNKHMKRLVVSSHKTRIYFGMEFGVPFVKFVPEGTFFDYLKYPKKLKLAYINSYLDNFTDLNNQTADTNKLFHSTNQQKKENNNGEKRKVLNVRTIQATVTRGKRRRGSVLSSRRKSFQLEERHPRYQASALKG